MPTDREVALAAIADIALPDGRTLGQADLIRAFAVERDTVRFVLEVADAEAARALAPVEAEARRRLEALDGVAKAQIVMTAAASKGQPARSSGGGQDAPPSLQVGRHPTAQAGPQPIAGVKHIVAIGSGKGGVGKSTVSANLAVALARAGRKVGLLDADIYGPSQPRMMGVSGRPASPDGQRIEPLRAHGVTVMSIGLMLPAMGYLFIVMPAAGITGVIAIIPTKGRHWPLAVYSLVFVVVSAVMPVLTFFVGLLFI